MVNKYIHQIKMQFFRERNWAIIIGTLSLGGGFWIFYCLNKFENVPTFFLAWIASIFAYLSFNNVREKIRLELFEKRFSSYQGCLHVCSLILKNGNIPDAKKFLEEREAFEKSANESFRGYGYHFSYFLFGNDIKDLYNEVNRIYSHLSAYSDKAISELHGERRLEAIEKRHKYLERTWEITQQMPASFSKYLDMGDYVKK